MTGVAFEEHARAAIPEVRAMIRRVKPEAVVGEVIGIGITGPVLAVDDPQWGVAAAKAAVMPNFSVQQRQAIIAGESAKLVRVAGPHTLTLVAGYADVEVPFLVTERLPIPSLRSIVQPGGQLHAADAVALLLGLASALWSCHAAGLVHLDVKPRNVGISTSGRATLMDFGLARAQRNARVHKLPAGTLPYSAPELVREGNVGPPTDVWGLGLLAHIVLTGRYPGRRPSTWGELFRRGAVQPPPLATVRPDVPESVAAVIDTALSVDPSGRPADGQEVFEALLGAANTGFGAGWQRHARYFFEAPDLAGPSALSG